MIKILTIIGARPQFIKSKMMSLAFKNANIQEIIVHTSQHYDSNMSDIFFSELSLNEISYKLSIPPNLSAMKRLFVMTQQIIPIIQAQKPDFVLVYGDTDSTLSGAFGAYLTQTRLIHIEAGLRSYNTKMPEEANRILSDRLSYILCTPTTKATQNLIAEGFSQPTYRIIQSGDIMLDLALHLKDKAKSPHIQTLDAQNHFTKDKSFVLDSSKEFCIATLHRNTNTDDKHNLESIYKALDNIAKDICMIFPLHPRTKQALLRDTITPKNIIFCEPLSYLEMSYCMQHCVCVFSDSGGIQKEAFFFHKPHITLREESEYDELVKSKYSILVGADTQKIQTTFAHQSTLFNHKFDEPIFGNGNAHEIILHTILQTLS